MENIKLAVVGSRTFNNVREFLEIMNIIKQKYNITTIVSGGARGADSMGEEYADRNKLKKIIFKADWNRYGKKAGYIRNVDIIKNCDVCIAFWDGESHGTKHDIDLSKQYNKKCFIYNFIDKSFIENE